MFQNPGPLMLTYSPSTTDETPTLEENSVMSHDEFEDEEVKLAPDVAVTQDVSSSPKAVKRNCFLALPPEAPEAASGPQVRFCFKARFLYTF